MLYVRQNDYFTKSNSLCQQQYDFRMNHSTSLTNTDCYESLLQNLDKNFYLMIFVCYVQVLMIFVCYVQVYVGCKEY